MPSCSPLPNPRKRTTSFFEPLPRKTSRTMPLQRTESFLCLSDMNDDCHTEGSSFLHMTPSPPPSPRFPPLSYVRHQEPRRRAEFTIAPSGARASQHRGPRVAPKQKPKPKPQSVPYVRTTSPLAPACKPLPPRATFPRSKPEPDLYRTALKGQMRSSPEGEQILRMGPRLAIAILSATRDLERIVSAHEDDDVMMADDTEHSRRRSWGLGVAVPCGA